MKLFLTKDQSHTLYVPELDETYHSRNGALEEAQYVYIGRGLEDWLTNHPDSTSIAILEIGFGTALNTWLTALACAKKNKHCYYVSLETNPLPYVIIEQLNYTDQADPETKQWYQDLHTAPWNERVIINAHFSLTKQQISLQDFIPKDKFDIIYFDAFAPEKQPELWTQELFQKLYDCLNPNGVIVTYSSKGAIKRMWREIGLEVERLPGPPMKRHMLRGRRRFEI